MIPILNGDDRIGKVSRSRTGRFFGLNFDGTLDKLPYLKSIVGVDLANEPRGLTSLSSLTSKEHTSLDRQMGS